MPEFEVFVTPQNGPAGARPLLALKKQNRAENQANCLPTDDDAVGQYWLREPMRAFLVVMRPDVVEMPSASIHKAHFFLADGILAIL